MDIELIKAIARIRRAMPRNVDVMAVCEALEALLQQKVAEANAFKGYALAVGQAIKNRDKETFDRRSYMREYMRNRRRRALTTP